MDYSDLGFVPVEEINNVFVEQMTVFENEMRKNGIPANPAVLVEWLDGVRLKLFQKAKFNIETYIRRNPHIKKAQTEEKAADAKSNEQLTWESRREQKLMKEIRARQASPDF